MFKKAYLTCWLSLTLIGAALPGRADALQAVNPADRAMAEERRGDSRGEERGFRSAPEVTRQVDGPLAAAPGDTAQGASAEHVIGAIRVSGAERLGVHQFASTIEPYLGRSLSRDELARLAGQIADILRREGFGLATAWVPAQSLDGGILVVEIDEGRVDALRVTGPGAPIVESRLRPLVGRSAITTAEIEQRLIVAGDAAGVIVSEARLVRENGRNILTVNAGLNHARAEASLDNWGSSSIGPLRMRADVDVNGVISSGDQFSVGGVFTPAQPDELQVVRARYATPIASSSTELALYGAFAHTRSGAGPDGTDKLTGTSIDAGLEISRALERNRKGGLWAFARIGLYDSRLSYNGDLIYDDRIVTASFSLSGNRRMLGGRAWGRIGITTGLDLLDATRSGDPLASRYDADGTPWIMDYGASLDRPLGKGWSVRIATEGQISSKALLSALEFGLGGRFFVRGFNFREFVGDEGAAGSIELRHDINNLPQPVRTMQFYAFVDGGRVFNGENRYTADLASAGGGVRATMRGGVYGSVEIGVPLTPGYFGNTPSPRVSFSLTARF